MTRKIPFKPRPRPKQLKGLALNTSAPIEARYLQSLNKLIRGMTDQVNSDLKQFFEAPVAEQYFAQDDTVSNQAKMIMAALMNKFRKVFEIAAPPLATRMTAETTKYSASSLEASMKKLSQGLTLKTDILSGDLHDILRATVTENVSLIKSIPNEYLTQVEGAVMRSITTGRGLEDLVPFLRNQEGVTLRRARVIARDQTRKAYSNINFERMKEIGVQEYEWLHSAGGQKPRQLHQRMSGNIYRIDKPPIIDEKTGQRGKPGDLINCRCRAIPVIKFNEA